MPVFNLLSELGEFRSKLCALARGVVTGAQSTQFFFIASGSRFNIQSEKGLIFLFTHQHCPSPVSFREIIQLSYSLSDWELEPTIKLSEGSEAVHCMPGMVPHLVPAHLKVIMSSLLDGHLRIKLPPSISARAWSFIQAIPLICSDIRCMGRLLPRVWRRPIESLTTCAN